MQYEDVMSILTILTLTSASVERFLEILSKIIESLGLFSKEKQGTLAAYSEKMMKQPVPETNNQEASDDEMGTAEGDPSAVVILTTGEVKDRNLITKKFVLQMGGCLVGIFLCWRGDLALFKMLGSPLGASLFSTWSDYILTGILIGTGTEPIHALIRMLQAQQDFWRVKKEPAQGAPEAPEEKVPESGKAKPLINIPYFGGLNPHLCANRLRTANPDMIIYHHTAMYSNTTFEQVVQVFEARGFPTGFHAIITADGVCHNYCRWDARGIHAPGYNDRALGLAFCGNFESDPSVPGSNRNGEMGNLVPTDEQLLTGAKVAALWALLYQIDIEVKGKLTPHKDLAPAKDPTACPGSNFPYARFEALVAQLMDDWIHSPQAQSEIQDFAKKDFLFIKKDV